MTTATIRIIATTAHAAALPRPAALAGLWATAVAR